MCAREGAPSPSWTALGPPPAPPDPARLRAPAWGTPGTPLAEPPLRLRTAPRRLRSADPAGLRGRGTATHGLPRFCPKVLRERLPDAGAPRRESPRRGTRRGTAVPGLPGAAGTLGSRLAGRDRRPLSPPRAQPVPFSAGSARASRGFSGRDPPPGPASPVRATPSRGPPPVAPLCARPRLRPGRLSPQPRLSESRLPARRLPPRPLAPRPGGGRAAGPQALTCGGGGVAPRSGVPEADRARRSGGGSARAPAPSAAAPPARGRAGPEGVAAWTAGAGRRAGRERPRRPPGAQ